MLRIFSNLWEEFKEYIILVVLLVVSLILISLNEQPGIKKVKAISFGTFASVTSVISDVFSTSSLRSENETLRRKNAELMLKVNKLRDYEVTNKELKGLVGIKDTTTFPLLPATIISKSLSRSQNVFTLNKGENDGIKPGMPVINDQGLVGIIYNTSGDFSIVRTLRNSELKLAVKNQRSRVDGLMKWNGSDLVIVNVPKTYDIKPNDIIVTSDISSIIPFTIPVGKVVELTQVETGIFNEVRLTPIADLDRSENVFVIKVVQSKQKNDLELNFFNK
ncbi:MAG TPA: rod shape-determining protein MreC [Ignavibacteriaceae bacterium]|nr:rod shape-determining protein MreC [Ignavibacteriaceae bacterium]